MSAARRSGVVAILLALLGSFAIGQGHAALAATPSYALTTAWNPGLQRTEVVRWSPCSVIDYRINGALGGTGARQDVQAALARITAASGLRFRYLGSTTFVPTSTRTTAQAAVAPLVISWARTGTSSYLPATGQPAHGGWIARPIIGQPLRISQGYVVLRAGTPLHAGFGSGVTRGRVLLHELGHVFGLSHVLDRTQVMYESLSVTSPPAALGSGDVAGLRRQGDRTACS